LAPEPEPGEPETGSVATESEPPASETPASETPAETPAPSARHAEIVATLAETLGDGFIEHHYSAREAWVRVTPGSWRETGRVCKEQLGLTYLCFVSAIDWKQAPDLGAEKLWDPEAEPTEDRGDGPGRWVTGLAGGETRFQVFARVADVVRHLGLFLKTDAGDEDPRAESWVPLFRGADWHEREAWEMYGVEFDGHPGLRHLYLPGEFEGFPLRKDFPLLAREVKPWPGLVNVEGLPGEDEPTESGDVGEE
jgi:NADH-quinone oxidoreductase subunit C